MLAGLIAAAIFVGFLLNTPYLPAIVAIAIVYLVMVATFRSLVQPLILLVSIPFAATGALGLLLVTGVPLGVAQIHRQTR